MVGDVTGRGLALKAASAGYEVLLRLQNVLSRRPATSDHGPVVSLTSYGHRLRKVFLTAESIARGTLKPSRLIIWISDPDVLSNPPRSLVRLARRGVELRPCPDIGPHKKYFPLVMESDDGLDSFVTADDDVYYHARWLSTLVAAHRQHPSQVIALRAREIGVTTRDEIAPYSTWDLAARGACSARVFPTGVGGVLYPRRVIQELRAAGDAFLDVAPRADDVWLHMLTLRSGTVARQIASPSRHELIPVRGAGAQGLWEENVQSKGNDVQIAATYPPDIVSRIVHTPSEAGGGTA